MLERQYFLHESGQESGSGGGAGESSDEDDSGAQLGDDGQSGKGEDELVPRSELQKANSEAAKRKRELRDAQKRIEELEGQSKTELEREKGRADGLQKDLDAALQKARDLRVQVIAARVGIVAEARSDAARLLDWEQVSDPDDDSSVEAALRDLVKDKTFLLGNVPAGADGGAGGTRDANSGDMSSLIRGAAGRQ